MCKNGNINNIKKILKIKPDINISVDNDCGFRWVCKNGHLNIIKILQG